MFTWPGPRPRRFLLEVCVGRGRSHKEHLKILEKRLRFLEKKIEAEPFGRWIFERAEIKAFEWAMPILWEHFVGEKETNGTFDPSVPREEI